jgi:hypothetical protein
MSRPDIGCDAEQRQLARERDHFLCQIATSGEERQETSGLLQFVGPLSPECVEELWALVLRWMAEGKV